METTRERRTAATREEQPLEGPSSGEERRPQYIVGIGASAGGLEALEQLFRHLPPDTGMSFVVVQHLSPDFESVMDELLVRQTELPVRIVENGMTVEPNVIYLIPPKKEMIISEGRLLLTDKDPSQGLTLPIDQFFRSLAHDAGSRAVGVILSGTGSDGSRGIRDIHTAGGLVIVQSEETAKFDGMPRSALETGIVDLVLAPKQIAETLAKYARHPIIRDLSPEILPVNDEGITKLFRLLRDAYGLDFSHYKPSTVARRIERRLLLNHTLDFEQYVERAASDPLELNSLYKDLLIGVTQFFRDKEAFAMLEQRVLPELLQRIPPEGEVRVWVAGCATGEEAYSLAMLLHEQLTALRRPVNVKIFATDVHEKSLDVASTGVYAPASLTDVSPERLARYFQRKGDEFQVAPELRQMIVFAQHNLIKDAPFTRLDLVSCRNLLIYLQPSAQRKVISLFHFGLKTGGVLFLGPSEGVGELEDEFTPIDRHWKVYRKRRDIRLPADLRLPLPVPGAGPRVHRGGALFGDRVLPEAELLGMYDQLLERYVPSGLLVNADHEVLHVFGRGADYVQVKSGRTTNQLFELLEPGLKTAVSGAVQRATKELKPVVFTGLTLARPTGTVQVRLGVVPLLNRESELSHLLLTLEDVSVPSGEGGEPAQPVDLGEVSRERIELLEAELRHTRENLQAMIEELETSNEELHATNEELVASNEELQSTNEELHSVNEELYTVNAEYQRKVTELTELTDDMNNLLACTEIGTVFLDRNLCIRKLTPQIARAFNFLPQDVGRPFDSFTHHIVHPTLMDDIRRVLATGEPLDQEVLDRFQHWYLLRLRPYRSAAGIEGVVLTLVDIQSIKETQQVLAEKDRLLQTILGNAPAFIFVKDLEGRYVMVNRKSQEFLGISHGEVIGKTDHDFLPAATADRIQAHDRLVLTTGDVVECEEVIARDGRESTYLSVRYPLRDGKGRITGVAGISSDITRRKEAERTAANALRQRDRFLAMLSHELRTPLGAIRNSLQLLAGIPLDHPVARRAYEVLDRQTSQLTRLTDDLLDVARIAQGKIELKRRVLDLRQTAQDAAQAVQARMTSRKLDFFVELPDEPLYVRGDVARLQQVQVNLLVNAAKYTPAGGIVRLILTREGQEAVIRVEDTGAGMSRDLLEQIFEPFVQSEQTLDRSEGGIGVGLTLARSLVRLHGGRITAASDGPGTGSIFTVRLPLTPQRASEDNSPAPPLNLEESKRLRLLLVEDNHDAREMLQLLLEMDGYAVASAADGPSGLEAILRDRPDVALVDIGLPERDGYELARQVRATLGNDGPFLVALTGYGQPTDKRRALEAGFDMHVTKPLDKTKLQELLQQAVSRQRPKTSSAAP